MAGKAEDEPIGISLVDADGVTRGWGNPVHRVAPLPHAEWQEELVEEARKLILHRPFHIIWLVLVGVAFLASRLYNLTVLPTFVDESIHIHSAVEIAESGDWLDTDRTRLLIIWILRLLLPITSDIIWSGRLISGLMGLLAAIGCYLVGKSLFNRRTGAVAFTLYVVSPFTLSNDRLIMSESYLVAWTVLTMWLSITMVRSRRPWLHSIGLGFILSLATLTKLSGPLVWGFPLLSLILLNQDQWRKFPKRWLALTYAVALLLSFPVSWTPQVGLKEALDHSVAGGATSSWGNQLWQNVNLLISWLWSYLTPGLGVASVVAVVFALWKRPREGLLLTSWLLAFTVPWFIIGEFWYPRYILPAFPALFILLGNLLDSLLRWMEQLPKRERLVALSLGLAGAVSLTVPALYFDYWQLRDPARAPFPEIDRYQYIEGWSAGYRVSGMVEFLRAQAAEKGDIFVVMSEGVESLMGELAFDVWRGQEESLHILKADIPRMSAAEISEKVSASPLPIYWLVDGSRGPAQLGQEVQSVLHINEMARFSGPGGKSTMVVYSVSAK